MEESKEAILKSYLSINPIKNRSVSLQSIDKDTKKNIIKHDRKYIITEPILEYKPRRKIIIKPTEYPLTSMGKSTLDISKPFMSQKQNLTPISYSQDINVNSDLEFKTNYILKYAQNADNFYKFRKCNTMISEEKRRNYDELYTKLEKNIENQSRIFFDNKNFEDNQNESNNFQIKNMICFFYDYNNNINKFCNLLMNELKNEKEQNSTLIKKNYELNLKLTSKIKELDELNAYLNRYDVSSKLYVKKAKEQTIDQIKNKYYQKENSHLLSIYNLEEEIKDLTQLLDKNKEFYNKYIDTEKLVEEKKKQNDQMRFAYTKELHEKNIQFAIERDKQDELIMKVQELEEVILKLKDETERHKRTEIELQAQIKKLQMIIEEKIESIVMMNEELEYFMREYNKEKVNHKHTFQALQTLENRVTKEKEEREQKEKKEEEERKKKQEENKKKEEKKDEDKKDEEKKNEEKKNEEKKNEEKKDEDKKNEEKKIEEKKEEGKKNEEKKEEKKDEDKKNEENNNI